MKILITGSHGQIGTALRHHVLSHHFTLISCPREILNITEVESIHQTLKQHKPDIVMNTAAYTHVDQAEIEQEKAMRINCMGTKYLAQACEQYHIPLIHLSTDYIFDGTQLTPYKENDRPHPLNIYGQSKRLGEEMIRAYCQQHIIFRVSGVFSQYKNNFFKTMLQLAHEKKDFHVMADQIICPTFAHDIADALFFIAKHLKHFGTFHYCSAQPTSWYQFAIAIIQEAKKYHTLRVENITATSSETHLASAKRPAYSVLNCQKINDDFGIKQPSWKQALITLFQKQDFSHAISSSFSA